MSIRLFKTMEDFRRKKIYLFIKDSGWYSVSDEAFYTESEIIEKDIKLSKQLAVS